MGLFNAVGDFLGLTDSASENEMKGFMQKSRQAAFDTAGALRQGGYDQQEAENLFQQQDQQIGAGAAQAGRQAATGYGNRGLGKSGMAMAAQNDVAFKRAVQSRMARLAAIEQATGNRFRNNTAAMAGYNTIYGQDSGNWNQAASRNQSGIGSILSGATAAGGMAATGGFSGAMPALSSLSGMADGGGGGGGFNLGNYGGQLSLSPEILALLGGRS